MHIAERHDELFRVLTKTRRMVRQQVNDTNNAIVALKPQLTQPSVYVSLHVVPLVCLSR